MDIPLYIHFTAFSGCHRNEWNIFYHLLLKKDTNFRKAIPPAQRLMLTLRFLAYGDSQISLTYLFRMGKKTVSRIISETSEALYEVLSKMYLNAP